MRIGRNRILTVAALLVAATSCWLVFPPKYDDPAIRVTAASVDAAQPGLAVHAANPTGARRAPTGVDGLPLSEFADVVLDRDPEFGTPHFIRRRAGFLSSPAPGVEPREILRGFIEANAGTMTLHPSDLEGDNAYVARDYRSEGMRHVYWQQRHEGIDIFRAGLRLNLTDDHRIINVSSRALYMPSVRFHRDDRVDEDEAMRIAIEALGGGEVKHTFVVRRVWYPLDMISAVMSWEVALEVTGNAEAHDFVIRADTGEIVFDQSLTWGLEDVSMQVWTGDSPAPFTPGPDAPTNDLPAVVTREWVTNAAGWIPDGSNELLGNNADVYADRDDDDAPDGARVAGSPYRVFDPPVDLAQAPDAYIPFSQVQGFYYLNLWHDRTYALGFDEAAGNFQQDNFGRGGASLDRMKLEVQNGADLGFGSANQAWYTGFGDGFPGRISVSIFGRSSPHRCGALDGMLIVHEATHGMTSRLVGNGFGLTQVQSRGLAEGWSDFFALSLFAEPGDDPRGVYPMGGYAGVSTTWPTDSYYGIRRFPYSTDMSKAPQTFADTDPNQVWFPPEIPRHPRFGSEDADQIHNLGEVWCLALWECRARLIDRYGFAGNELMMQLVVDGLKLTPVDPRFDQARDAILQADLVANGGTNAVTLWEGFAQRGLGWSAQVPEPQSTVGIVEAFDLPFGVEATVTESTGDGDGFIEPGESAGLSISLTSHELDLTNVTAVLTAHSSNITVTVGSATIPDLVAGGTAVATPAFAFTVGPAFPGFTDALFTLRIESDKGAFDQPLAIRIGNPGDYPPEITDIVVTGITETNATVEWSTGIPSDGFVRYGLDTNYPYATGFDPALRTNHTAGLTGLTKGTDYHFQIVSRGSNGLVGVSGNETFRTRSRIYVWADSPAGQELGTIEAPYKTLQAAAEEARATGDEILVAEGLYTGAHPEAVLNLDGIAYDLKITGGYSPEFIEHHPLLHETVIDGENQRRGIRLDNGAALELSNATITRGHGEWGGGIHVRKSELKGSRLGIIRNSATNGINQFGGAVYSSLESKVTISSSSICSNQAKFGGGIELVSLNTLVKLEHSVIRDNESTFAGGGVDVLLGAEFQMMECLVVENSSLEATGGGINISPFSCGVLVNSTISNNRILAPNQPASDGGGGIRIAGSGSGPSELFADGLVVYGNEAPIGRDLLVVGETEVHISHSNFGEILGALASSNSLLSIDPRFANPAVGDYHILQGSPCIDAGSPSYSEGGVDIDGEPRVFGSRIDIGADEYTDVDGDDMADYWETNHFSSIAVSDGSGNDDADGLTDSQEYLLQTDPLDADTDDDEGADGFEVGLGMDPLNPDEDQDAMADGWEAHRGLDWTINDAALNPDADPMNNLSEYLADTDPFDAVSYLGLTGLDRAWGGTRLDWQGGVNAWQWLERTKAPTNSTWDVLLAFPPPSAEDKAVILFGPEPDRAIYRIRAGRNPP